jgi:hypothetical protein
VTDFHAIPHRPSAEDHFADTLDALALGMPVTRTTDEPLAALANLAATLQHAGPVSTSLSSGRAEPTLDRASKSRIWADLMREHGGADTSETAPREPGAAGSALSLNPWVTEPDSTRSKRPRLSPGVLRFMPAAQPTGTFLFIVAVLILVGATFAGLSPNGGRGSIPTAFATEDPPQFAFASPQASPAAITGTCEPERMDFPIDPEDPYAYEPTRAVASRTIDALGPFFATFSACMAGPQFAEMSTISTVRFMDVLRASMDGIPDANLDDRIAGISEYWTFSLEGQQDVQSFTWEGSGGGDEPMHLNVFPGTARMLADGRVGVITSIAPAAVSPTPDQSWIDSKIPGTYGVSFVALATGQIVDEMLGHCGGADCVAKYGPDAEPQAPLPALEGSVPEHIRIEVAGVDAQISEIDWFTGPAPLPDGRWDVGWWMDSAAAGAPADMNLLGYLDALPEGPATFQNLDSLPVGSPIEITGENGSIYTYELDAVTPRLFLDDPASDAVIAEYLDWTRTFGAGTLLIVAYGGSQDRETGEFAYVVLARASLVESTAPATPAASPVATTASADPECDVEPLTITQIEHIRDSGSTQPPREYAPAVVPDHTAPDNARDVYATINACTANIDATSNVALMWALMTDRAVLENSLGIGTEIQLERSRELSERYGDLLLGPALTAGERDQLSQASASSFFSEIVHLLAPDRAIVRQLPDGRLALYSGDVWLRRESSSQDLGTSPNREIFQYTILGNPRYGGGLDETLYICLGDCDSFWVEWETDTYLMPVATPAASPVANPVASPSAATARRHARKSIQG